MAIQLNRTQRSTSKLRNTCERRHDLTASIMQNFAAAKDPYAPVYHTLPVYAPAAAAVETYEPTEAIIAPLETYEVETIIEAAQSMQALPQPGVWRTDRGTIELIMHPTGTFVKPHYNYCGILLSVEMEDGSRFVRQHGSAPWVVLNPNGSPVDELQVTSLTIDRAGNIIYVTADGVRTVIQHDGMIHTTRVS